MVNGINSASDTKTPDAKTASSGNTMVSKDTFLQLLVAQIKHQDPLSPADGVQFLTQLAQFSELEQLVNMGTDISQIRASLTDPRIPAETDLS